MVQVVVIFLNIKKNLKISIYFDLIFDPQNVSKLVMLKSQPNRPGPASVDSGLADQA
jgi:hypothetical protein